MWLLPRLYSGLTSVNSGLFLRFNEITRAGSLEIFLQAELATIFVVLGKDGVVVSHYSNNGHVSN
jgi:hypothetical protein